MKRQKFVRPLVKISLMSTSKVSTNYQNHALRLDYECQDKEKAMSRAPNEQANPEKYPTPRTKKQEEN
jgi:hypothetical protein